MNEQMRERFLRAMRLDGELHGSTFIYHGQEWFRLHVAYYDPEALGPTTNRTKERFIETPSFAKYAALVELWLSLRAEVPRKKLQDCPVREMAA